MPDDAWPFTVSAGSLKSDDDPLNDRQYVTFETDGIDYALNRSAIDLGYPTLDASILKDFPDKSKVLPLITRGLQLC